MFFILISLSLSAHNPTNTTFDVGGTEYQVYQDSKGYLYILGTSSFNGQYVVYVGYDTDKEIGWNGGIYSLRKNPNDSSTYIIIQNNGNLTTKRITL